MHTDQYNNSTRGQPCSRAPSTPNFYGLVLGTYSLGLEGPGLGLGHGLESCVENFWHDSQTQGLTATGKVKLKVCNSYNNKIIIYM